jgi:hypothetical protein
MNKRFYTKKRKCKKLAKRTHKGGSWFFKSKSDKIKQNQDKIIITLFEYYIYTNNKEFEKDINKAKNAREHLEKLIDKVKASCAKSNEECARAHGMLLNVTRGLVKLIKTYKFTKPAHKLYKFTQEHPFYHFIIKYRDELINSNRPLTPEEKTYMADVEYLLESQNIKKESYA